MLKYVDFQTSPASIKNNENIGGHVAHGLLTYDPVHDVFILSLRAVTSYYKIYNRVLVETTNLIITEKDALTGLGPRQNYVIPAKYFKEIYYLLNCGPELERSPNELKEYAKLDKLKQEYVPMLEDLIKKRIVKSHETVDQLNMQIMHANFRKMINAIAELNLDPRETRKLTNTFEDNHNRLYNAAYPRHMHEKLTNPHKLRHTVISDADVPASHIILKYPALLSELKKEHADVTAKSIVIRTPEDNNYIKVVEQGYHQTLKLIVAFTKKYK
jgi:hypothetical protein